LAQKEAAEKLAKEKAEFEAKQKAIDAENKKKQEAIETENKKKADAAEAEQKAIADANEKTRLANEATLKVIADAQAKLDADKKEAEQLIIGKKGIEKLETTVYFSKNLAETPFTPQESFTTAPVTENIKAIEVVSYDLPKEPTWTVIFESFKQSGEKSLSKWLEVNYNVPTKK
jgi:hypothetical protein